MSRPFSLAWLYLVGSVRRQVHVSTILLALLLLSLPFYISEFSLGVNAFERVSKDFGLTLIGLFTAGMAIMVGSTSIPRDLESRAIYPILARPLSRGDYLLGHFLALAALLAGVHLVLGLTLFAGLALKGGALDPRLMLGVYGCFLQALVVGCICLAFSVLCSPALAGTIGMAGLVVGNLSGAFIRFFLMEDRESGQSAMLARTVKGLAPNLTLFDIKDPVVHELALPAGYLSSVSYYAVIWLVVLLLLARVALLRRDL